MPTISTTDASERLAENVERAGLNDLKEYYFELFPEGPLPASLAGSDLAKLIRDGLAPEEIVDLWNVVFPEARRVSYDEEEKVIRYNEEVFDDLD
jgi:hypothetical protein